MCGKSVTKVNEAALSNVLADVTFIESEIKRLERPALDKVFDEVKMVSVPPPRSFVIKLIQADIEHHSLGRRGGLSRTLNTPRPLLGRQASPARHHPHQALERSRDGAECECAEPGR